MKNKMLVLGILLIIAGIGLMIYYNIQNNKIDASRINIHDITSSGAKNENINVYLNASYLVDNIANYENDTKNSFYVVFGDEVQYLVYMNNNLAKKINNYLLDNPSSTYKIVGITRKIPKDLEDYGKQFVKKWLDANHNHEENEDSDSHEITTDEFYEYFGYVYLDNIVKVNKSIEYILYVAYIIFLIGLLIILKEIFKNVW